MGFLLSAQFFIFSFMFFKFSFWVFWGWCMMVCVVLRLLGILFCGELALNSVTRLVLSILILLQLIKIKKEERVFNPGDFVLACC